MRYVVLSVLVALMLFGCTSQQPSTPAGGNTSYTGKTVEINMTAKQFDYSPSTITVHKGDHVKLTITSMDNAHGFSLPAFDVNEQIQPGQTQVIEFDADKSGSFAFSCSVPCGPGHFGMKGTLVVQG